MRPFVFAYELAVAHLRRSWVCDCLNKKKHTNATHNISQQVILMMSGRISKLWDGSIHCPTKSVGPIHVAPEARGQKPGFTSQICSKVTSLLKINERTGGITPLKIIWLWTYGSLLLHRLGKTYPQDPPSWPPHARSDLLGQAGTFMASVKCGLYTKIWKWVIQHQIGCFIQYRIGNFSGVPYRISIHGYIQWGDLLNIDWEV